MTDLERAETKFQRQIDFQNARIDKIDLKIDGLVKSLDDFKQEMRNKDNQRAAEAQAIRAEMLAKDAQRAAEMSEIRTSLQNIQSSGRNLNIVTLLGIAAMIIAILLK